jgi:hypothetical protein
MLHINQKTQSHHKKAFMSELLVGLMLFVVFSADFAAASDITADMVIKLTNKARQSANVAELKRNALLEQAAQNKAQDMIEKNYFAHISPVGRSPWNWINEAGYDYRFAGENLAIDFSSAEKQQQAWMESPLHKKNILNSDYKEIGVAVRRGNIDGRETIITVQEFGTTAADNVAVSFTNQDLQTKQRVAGLEDTQPNYAQPIKKMELRTLFENNTLTLVGWFSIFGIIILVIAVDVAAVFHEKHRQLLILHSARKKNA